jgi:DNA-binding transcriptional MocR family regulator
VDLVNNIYLAADPGGAAARIGAVRLARLLGGAPVDRPYYAALAKAMRGLALDGRLPARTRLPAERDLATALGVSRTTVTAAYDALRADGFVESRQGSGSWTALPTGGPVRMRSPATQDLIDLGCVAPAAPSCFDDAVAGAVARLPGYSRGPGYEAGGLAVLREAVAARYTGRGLPTLPEQILITSGALHGLNLILAALTNPGDAVLVESPTYPHALDAIRAARARLVPTGVNAGWDVDLMAAAMRQAAVRLAYLIPDFQNPTGHLMDDDQRAAVVAAARRADAFVVADESFAELAIDDLEMPRAMGVHDTDGRVIGLGSASKLMWGGLRIGWVRTTQALVRRLVEVREALDLATSVLDQLIAVELLSRVTEVRAERRRTLAERRRVLSESLRTLEGWTHETPQGGLSLWVRLPGQQSTTLSAAAAARGVHLVPGPAFGVDGVLDDHLRLPYVLAPDILRDAIRRLAEARHDQAPVAASPRVYV